MTGKTSVRIWTMIISLIAVLPGLLLVHTEIACAQAGVSLSPTTLVFHSVVNESIQRTFTLTVEGEPIKDLSVVRHDLVDPNTHAAILSDSITVDPASRDEVKGVEQFGVTISAGKKAGHFTGNLELMYAGQPKDKPLIVTLDVTLEPVPAVDADVNSKNLTLAAVPAWGSFLFGRPNTAPNAPVLGTVTISLVQNAEGAAIIEEANVLALRGPNNQTLPENTVSVTTSLPLTLTERGSASIQLVARGKNLRAGEYNGTLQVKVRNQPTSVQIPLKVQVKDGWLLPLILLAAGPVVGSLLNWYNNQGHVRLRLQREIAGLQTRIDGKKKLQDEDQKKAREALNDAIEMMVAGEEVAKIDEQIKATKKIIEEAEAAADILLGKIRALVGKLEALAAETKELPVAESYRSELERKLVTLTTDVEGGKFQRLNDEQGKFEEADRKEKELSEIIAKFKALPQGEQEQARISPTLDALRQSVGLKKAEVRAAPAEISPQEKLDLAYDRYKLTTKWGHILTTGLVYLLVLVIGSITFYVSSATFGANPEDYVALLLWGVASNVIGGQTINLKTIYDQAKAQQ